jgi:F-type H+-transporting ATPase subunit b
MEIYLDQILFQIVNFSVVVGALTYLLYKPVLKIFEERSIRIAEGQKAAAEAIEQRDAVDTMRADVRKQLKKEKAEVLEAATKEAEAQRAQILSEARDQAAALIEEAKEQWEEERNRQMHDMREQMIDAVIATTEKVIESKLTKSDQSTLIDKELAGILKAL